MNGRRPPLLLNDTAPSLGRGGRRVLSPGPEGAAPGGLPARGRVLLDSLAADLRQRDPGTLVLLTWLGILMAVIVFAGPIISILLARPGL